MNKQVSLCLFSLAVVGLLLLIALSPGVFPFTTDSLIYVSTTQQVTTFQGLTFSNFFVEPAVPNFLPVMLEPPGFPLLIVLLKVFGFNEYTEAVILPRLFFVLLPFLFFLIFKRLTSTATALVGAALCTLIVPVIKCSLMAWTEIPYLFFSLVSIILAIYIVEKKGERHVLLIFLAGLVAGYTFFIRYIGITLIASIATGFVVSVFLRIISLRNLIRIFVIYGLGMALVVLPFLIRNHVVFGTIQPYKMPPSLSPFLVNLHDYFRGLAEIFFANRSFEIVMVLIVEALVIAFYFRSTQWIHRNKVAFVSALIVMAYFVYYSVFLIAYKTFCFGSEEIGDRYLAPIVWVIVAGIVYSLNFLLSKLEQLKMLDMKPIAGFIILTFFLIQIFPLTNFYAQQQKLKILSKEIEHYIPLVQGLPPEYTVVSNIADMTYYFSKRNVRMLANYTPYGLAQILGKKRYAVFIIKDNDLMSKAWEYLEVWKEPWGYIRAFKDQHVELFLSPANIDTILNPCLTP
jgi:hypothetical protein